MLMFGESDTVAHHFWAFHDPALAALRRAPARARSATRCARVYARARRRDRAAASARVPDATVLVVSDHGFGGAGTTGVHLNRWLAREGLSRASRARSRRRALGRAAARRGGARRAGALAGAAAFALGGGRLASRVESGVRFGGIDWRGTRAFSEELNYFPSIWLNVAGPR